MSGAITGGIAEAFYKTIPENILSSAWGKLPKGFRDTISALAQHSAYGGIFETYRLGGGNDLVSPDDIFAEALQRFFNGSRCKYTTEVIA